MQKSEVTPIDYLGLDQMAMTSTQIGLISSEVEKPPPRTETVNIEDFWQERPFLAKRAIFVMPLK